MISIFPNKVPKMIFSKNIYVALTITLLAVVPSMVIGYRSGPPTSACKSMKPGHAVGFRSGNSLYHLSPLSLLLMLILM